MKRITLRTADDTADLNPYAGELAEGETRIESGLLKNTGDVPLTSIRLRVVNADTLPATLSCTVGGVLLTDTLQELLTAPLAPGASLSVLREWTAGAELLNGEDSGSLTGTIS